MNAPSAAAPINNIEEGVSFLPTANPELDAVTTVNSPTEDVPYTAEAARISRRGPSLLNVPQLSHRHDTLA